MVRWKSGDVPSGLPVTEDPVLQAMVDAFRTSDAETAEGPAVVAAAIPLASAALLRINEP